MKICFVSDVGEDFESFIVALLDANKHGVDARTNFTT